MGPGDANRFVHDLAGHDFFEDRKFGVFHHTEEVRDGYGSS